MQPRLDTPTPPAGVPGLRQGAPLPPTALEPDASGPRFAQALASSRARDAEPGARPRAEAPPDHAAADDAHTVDDDPAERPAADDDARAAADLAALLAALPPAAAPVKPPDTPQTADTPEKLPLDDGTGVLPGLPASATPGTASTGPSTAADATDAPTLAQAADTPAPASARRLDPGLPAASGPGTEAGSPSGATSGRPATPGMPRPAPLEPSATTGNAADAMPTGVEAAGPAGDGWRPTDTPPSLPLPLSPAGLPAGDGGTASATSPGIAAASAPLPGSPAPGGAEAPVLHGRVAAHPASPQFVPQLAAQLEMFVREGVQNARLQLHPAELGPVAVQIQLEGGQAQVALAAEVASTRERLLEALPQLARQLEQGGLGWAGGSVGSQLADGRREPGAEPPAGRQNPGREGAGGTGGGDADPAAPAPRRSRGIVDLVA